MEETALRVDYLMGEMAHEIFHATAPFGQNADTLYEEYWAFYVGACVAGLSTTTIQLYDPLSPDDLSQYFIIARRANYLNKYALYPVHVTPKD